MPRGQGRDKQKSLAASAFFGGLQQTQTAHHITLGKNILIVPTYLTCAMNKVSRAFYQFRERVPVFQLTLDPGEMMA